VNPKYYQVGSKTQPDAAYRIAEKRRI